MSTIKADNIATLAGVSTSMANAVNGSAKAWVNFNGTFGTSPYTVANGGIRSAYNVTSVTDTGVGQYTINFTNPMPNVNFSAVLTVGTNSGGFGSQFYPHTYTQSSVSVVVLDRVGNVVVDTSVVNAAIFD